jgi:DNA (cytosine-5)-methyltransferase 1
MLDAQAQNGFSSGERADKDRQIIVSIEQRPTAISLFSGGGGLDIGFHQAGFRTLACIEIDEEACKTLNANRAKYFPDAAIVNADVSSVLVGDLMQRCGLEAGDLDVLYGGPPCQSFSQIGKKNNLSDIRGLLLFTMVDYARILKPKSILIENVKALKSAPDLDGNRGGALIQLQRALEELGYNVTHQIINSADFGVAQLRQRIFLIATISEKFSFPEFSHSSDNYLTVGEAISGLPKPVAKGRVPKFPNHIDVTPAGDKHRISYVDEGSFLAKMEGAPESVKGRLSRKDTTKFLRLGRKKQSNTLRCGEVFFHPTEDRYLTPREYMRLHGFPDDYILEGPVRGRSGSVRSLDQHRQIANSVPPPVARALARSLAMHLQNVDT